MPNETLYRRRPTGWGKRTWLEDRTTSPLEGPSCENESGTRPEPSRSRLTSKGCVDPSSRSRTRSPSSTRVTASAVTPSRASDRRSRIPATGIRPWESAVPDSAARSDRERTDSDGRKRPRKTPIINTQAHAARGAGARRERSPSSQPPRGSVSAIRRRTADITPSENAGGGSKRSARPSVSETRLKEPSRRARSGREATSARRRADSAPELTPSISPWIRSSCSGRLNGHPRDPGSPRAAGGPCRASISRSFPESRARRSSRRTRARRSAGGRRPRASRPAGP